MHQEMISIDALIDRIFNKAVQARGLYGVKPTQISDDVIEHIYSIVCDVFYQKVPREYIRDRMKKYEVWQGILEELKKVPVIVQRSPEWHACRQTLITASDFAQALGEGKFATQRQFYMKKCGYDDTPFDANLPPLRWGVMFEPIATSIYSRRNNTIVFEFGLLRHPEIDYLGASPDGINDLGIMLEVKCPYRRKITGEVPYQYDLQMQGQLDTCKGLTECDYLECAFTDAFVWEDFVEQRRQMRLSHGNVEHGVICEFPDGSFKYGPVYDDTTPLAEEHVNAFKAQCSVQSQTYTLHFWNLEMFNVVRVYKNEPFLKEKISELREVWNKVIEYRQNRDLYNAEVESVGKTSKRKTTGAAVLSGYAFID